MLLRGIFRAVVAGSIAAAGIALVPLTAAPSNAATNVTPTPRIVRGVDADRSATPWFVSLSMYEDGGWGTCGGTIIAPRWILTAAHCVDGMSAGDIARSAGYINPPNLYSEAGKVKWQQVIVHPGYNSSTVENDVALIQTTTVMPATPLPISSAVSPAGTKLQVFGFGYTADNGMLSYRLKQARIIDRAGPAGSCGEYGSDYIAADMLCAGDLAGKVDSCHGDSGGPLTAWAGERVLVGTVSWGDKCADPKHPGVYTRMSTYASWVASVSGVTPSSAPIQSHSPAQLLAHQVCGKASCNVNARGQVRLQLENSGDDPAQWKVKATKLGSKSGTQPGAAGKVINFKVKSKKKTCSTVTVKSAGAKIAVYKVPLNHGHC